MPMTIEKRLDNLERAINGEERSCRLVFAEEGETDDQAVTRYSAEHGIDVDERRVLIVRFRNGESKAEA